MYTTLRCDSHGGHRVWHFHSDRGTVFLSPHNGASRRTSDSHSLSLSLPPHLPIKRIIMFLLPLSCPAFLIFHGSCLPVNVFCFSHFLTSSLYKKERKSSDILDFLTRAETVPSPDDSPIVSESCWGPVC